MVHGEKHYIEGFEVGEVRELDEESFTMQATAHRVFRKNEWREEVFRKRSFFHKENRGQENLPHRELLEKLDF